LPASPEPFGSLPVAHGRGRARRAERQGTKRRVEWGGIQYKETVEKDLKRLGRQPALRIVDAIHDRLGGNPDAGYPLTGEYAGLFRFRVGDYRVIYAKAGDGILVLRIAHRKEAYR